MYTTNFAGFGIKSTSVVLAASCLSLLFIGIACHLVGYTANY